MTRSYLIAEEGPLAGLLLTLEPYDLDSEDSSERKTPQWILGRDPDVSDLSLEDPMVSRKHAIIRYIDKGFFLENLSTVNPITQNGLIVAEQVLLKEGDILQIGSTFFHFTYHAPSSSEESPTSETVSPKESPPPPPLPSDLHFGPHAETKWLLKVISGPNAGAELALTPNTTYLIGKDPNICDIVFQDLSVSRQHARLTVTSEPSLFIEDLGSRNGIIINGELVTEKHSLLSQDLIALGTTTFLVIDRLHPRETILSAPSILEEPKAEEKAAKSALTSTKELKHWKDLVIPKRHLIIAGSFFALIFTGLFAMVSLFKSEPIAIKTIDETDLIRKTIAKFPAVSFSFNQNSGRLFLMGDVLTSLEHQELLYLLKGIPFVHSVEDGVIVDELVWQNMNALLMTNPKWTAISMYAPTPGLFVLRGYTATPEDAEALSDYMNRNFDYLNKLENRVVVEKNLQLEIQSMLLEKGLISLNFELTNGEVILSGKVGEKSHTALLTLIQEIKKIPGIRVVKNYVALASKEAMRLDISSNYSITGTSSRDGSNCFVVINGKILSKGDTLDGMLITEIEPKMILLEKEGFGYVINYALQ